MATCIETHKGLQGDTENTTGVKMRLQRTEKWKTRENWSDIIDKQLHVHIATSKQNHNTFFQVFNLLQLVQQLLQKALHWT